MKCRECREAELEERVENYLYEESGLPVVLEDVKVRQCPNCGARIVSILRIEELHRAIAFDVAQQAAQLSAAEVRFLRTYLGWSGVDFAKAMGVDQATVSRWQNSDEPSMGATAERLLRLMVLRQKPIDEYPNERLGEVASEPARPGRMRLRLGKEGWREAAAA